MRVLLVHPPAMGVYGPFKPAAKLAAQPQMPLGILYIGAVLSEHGHQVRIIDGDVDQMGLFDILAELDRWKPNLVGVSATTPVYPTARKLLSLVKQKNPEIVTVLGGYHLTAVPQQTMAECPVDFGVYGEGEQTIVELAAALEQGSDVDAIAGILYRREGVVHTNAPRLPIADLDTLPFPSRRLLRYRQYIWSVPGKGLMPVTTIMTQRGCPYRCVFCGARTMFPRVRYRKIERIVDELEHIVKVLGVRHVQFSDDTLTLNADKTAAMCEEIRRRKLRLTWEGYTRADCISQELLGQMKAAGLVRLSFGVESGDERVLEGLKKGTTLEQYRQAYEWCEGLGLETRCSVMFGNPFETRAAVRRTLSFICSLPAYQAYVSIATPYPWTELLEMARQGVGGLRLLTEDWTEYRRHGNAVMETNDLRREDLIRLQRQAYLKFYLRPRIIWRNLKRAGWRAALNNATGFALSLFNSFRAEGRRAESPSSHDFI
jgi:anaerobic magnesium-protoporphyrin IX monomethyl ester cyclase